MAIDAKGIAGVNAEMLGGEEEGVGEVRVARHGLEARVLQMPVLEGARQGYVRDRPTPRRRFR